MKIIVLGGAGDMGSETVRDLAAQEEVTLVTVADRNAPAAEKLAASLPGGKGRAVTMDAAQPGDLVRVLAGHAVAAGALGPFYRFEKLLVEACLEAGVDYVSICDDHDAAEAALSLDGAAREKGRRILGHRGGVPVRLTYSAADHMRRLTGIPLSIGAIAMGKGHIQRHGVYGPEADGAMDPRKFLEELSRRGIVVESRMEELAH